MRRVSVIRMSGNGDLNIRDQRDLLTLVKCMLCLIPDGALSLREDFENMLVKLSYPNNDDLVYLNKEIALILFDYHEKYQKYTWMKLVFALYFNRNISDMMDNFDDDEKGILDLDIVRSLCNDSGSSESIGLSSFGNIETPRNFSKGEAVLLETLNVDN